MPVDKFGRRRTSVVHVHQVITDTLNKDDDFLLNVASDNNRSMGCVDLTSNKSFTLNMGDRNNKIVHTKDRNMTISASNGLEVLDEENEPLFKFDVNGQNEMHKQLNCQQNAITNLPDPVYSTDAVNKRYFVGYVRSHRAIRKVQSTIPDAPYTNIVLHRYNPRRLPSMISMYVEREEGVWIDVTCGHFAGNWKSFNLFIKDNSFMFYFTEVTGGPWTRKFILNYMVFMHE